MRILHKIHDLIKVSVGIDLATVGGSPLARGVKERMVKCGLVDEASYIDLIRNSHEELEELVELIVVPETWFFRDEKPFLCLQKYVKEEWTPSCPCAPIKILSLPCSSGEEPYTIAMALLDIGLNPEQMQIEAFDISRQALEKAQRGIYNLNSFRSRDMSFRDRYFRMTDEGYVLDEKVRRCVTFARGNMLMPGFAIGKGPYDAVFFRNLMIYLAPKQQDESMAVIDKLLSPSGVLFVGHAESLQALNRGYSPVRYPFGFAYRRSSQCGDRSAPPPPFAGNAAILAAIPAGGMPALPGGERLRQCTMQNHSASLTTRQLPQDDKTSVGRGVGPMEGGGSKGLRYSERAEARASETRFTSPAIKSPSLPRIDRRPPPLPLPVADPLALAFEMADMGRTEDAHKLCEASLATHPPKADAYYLLGLLQKTHGFAVEAEISLRKAVYLQPDHVQALAHLALAAEERGDLKAAELFQQRARQASERQGRN